jgi:hypothetical protein
MTSRDELLQIAGWHEHQLEFLPDHIHIPVRDFHVKAAAAIRELLTQEPMGWMYAPNDGSVPPTPWVRRWPEHTRSNWVEKPLYAAPVLAVDLEAFKAEAMRLYDEATESADTRVHVENWHALQAHLDKLGGKND